LPADSRPAALLLAPETPYPVAGGGALRTASLLHYLASRYEVDLIVFRQPDAPDPRDQLPPSLVRALFPLELPRNRRTFAARALRNASRVARGVPPLVDRFSGFGDAIARAIAGRRYEVAVVEHFWCAPYWEQVAPHSRRTVLDLHNIESVLHARSATVEPAAEAFAHGVFERAARDLERTWLPRYSSVLATSDCDAAAARRIAPAACVSVYPNAIPWTPPPPHIDEEAVVFSGNMEYHPNRSAVRFFRRDIWPQLRERWPKLVWRLVGKNPEAAKEFTTGDPRIELRGPVDDAVAELARCRVAVVPLLAASGTRLKILEAWAAGLPVVSTSIGAEGLHAHHGEHLLLADTAAAFVREVTRVLTCTDMRAQLGMAGRLLLEKEFTWEKAWDRLDF
jgi:glycosyltransferase involved in cell wall biosynthesis